MVNEDELFARLCAVGGPPIVDSPPRLSGASNERMSELGSLLTMRNGFYAFESALHVFPSGEQSDANTAEFWNEPLTWKAAYQGLADDLWCFAEDVLGVQFAVSGEVVVRFEPESGEREDFAASIADWVDRVLDDYHRVTGYPIAHEWQTQNGALAPGRRLLPVTPFVLGGSYEPSKLRARGAVEGMRARGDLAVRIRDLPDGTPIGDAGSTMWSAGD